MKVILKAVAMGMERQIGMLRVTIERLKRLNGNRECGGWDGVQVGPKILRLQSTCISDLICFFQSTL
jgi:hypothetical protein